MTETGYVPVCPSDRPARPRLQRRRSPPRICSGRSTRCQLSGSACSRPPRCTTPIPSARCSTRRASSTPVCASRQSSSRWSCSTRSSAWSGSWVGRRARSARPARDRHRHPAARRARAGPRAHDAPARAAAEQAFRPRPRARARLRPGRARRRAPRRRARGARWRGRRSTGGAALARRRPSRSPLEG